MTAQPTRDQLRALADKAARGPWTVDDGGGYDFSVTQGADGDYIASDVTPRDAAFIAAARTAVPQLLDQLDQAEHRIARLEARADIRGRAVIIYQQRAREAEARIKAVRELIDTRLDASSRLYDDLRRALESVTPPGQ